MSEKMAANSARPAAGGIGCEAVQFPSHWRSRYACTAEREHDRVNRSSISLSAIRKNRPVTLRGRSANVGRFVKALTRLLSGVWMAMSARYLCLQCRNRHYLQS